MIDRLIAWLGRGPTPLKIAAIAFALGTPALWTGYLLDDYAHLAAFSDIPRLNLIFKSPWHMFSFVQGDPEQTQAAMEQGLYPWWSSQQVVLNFWRPFTVVTHGLDHLFWPHSALMAHLQSLLWYAGLAALATMLYRRIAEHRASGHEGPAGAAVLAALLYAIDDAHAVPMGWIASRNATLAAFWGVACLIFHLKWRREGKPWALVAALLALATSVHSNEGGIATAGYLFAYAVFLDRGSAGRRLATLAPYAGVIVVWRAYYSWLGFGAKHSPVYIDPVADPMRFALSVVEDFPAYLMGQLTNFPSEAFYFFHGAEFAALWFVCAALVLGLAIGLWIPALRTREAGFWALGMTLAVVPPCATFPSNRLLLFVGLGGMGLIAHFIIGVGRSGEAAGRPRRALCVGLIVLHLILAPVSLIGMNVGFGLFGSALRGSVARIDLPEDVGSRTVVIANSPNYFMTAYMAIARSLNGRPAPGRLYSFSPNQPTFVPATMTRVDERTLRVEPEGGFPWLLFRSELEPYEAGDTVELEAMTVKILEVNRKGVPHVVEYRFDERLEDGGIIWLEIVGADYVPFELPDIGESIRLNTDE